MGRKIHPGSHTRTHTSPAGPPTNETATETTTTHTMPDGSQHTFTAQGVEPNVRYLARIPPNSDPPGEWHWIEFDEEEGLMLWTVTNQGNPIPIQHGGDFWNGPV